MTVTFIVMMRPKSRTFLFFIALFYLAWLVRATVFYSAVDLGIADETGRLIFSNAVKFALWVLPAAAYIYWLERDNPLTAMKITTPVDKRGLLIGLLVTLLFFVGVFTIEKLQSGRTLLPLLQASPGAWLAMLAQVAFSPLSEELMFRGFVLPQLAGRMSFWKANLLQALLFTAMHWPNWIWVSGLRVSLIATSAGIFLLALLLGWLLRRSNSIWPPVAAHIINNFLVAFLG